MRQFANVDGGFADFSDISRADLNGSFHRAEFLPHFLSKIRIWSPDFHH